MKREDTDKIAAAIGASTPIVHAPLREAYPTDAARELAGIRPEDIEEMREWVGAQANAHIDEDADPAGPFIPATHHPDAGEA